MLNSQIANSSVSIIEILAPRVHHRIMQENSGSINTTKIAFPVLLSLSKHNYTRLRETN